MSTDNIKTVAFVVCIDNEEYFNECVNYLRYLRIPEGYATDLLEIRDVENAADGFNEAMTASDAEYTVFLRQDVFVADDNLIKKILDAFENKHARGVFACVKDRVVLAAFKNYTFKEATSVEDALTKALLELGNDEGAILLPENSVNCDFYDGAEYSQEQALERDLSFLLRRAENQLPYYEYSELVDCIAAGEISTDYIKQLADNCCVNSALALTMLQRGLEGKKYDSLIAKVAPKPVWNLNYYRNKDTYTDGAIEDAIIKFFAEDNSGYYSKVIAQNPSWAVYYHLTHIRRNILNWYPFSGKEHALEIGCGMGAITDMLCEKCQHVTAVELSKQRATATLLRNKNRENLEIIVANLNDIEFTEKFDVITLIGVFEYQGKFTEGSDPYGDFLKTMRKLLKPDGKLFIAIENQYGLKYWCGAREDHTGHAFDGINQYRYNDGSVRTFSKQALENMLHRCGFEDTYFYYPMPDYKLPVEIYSQDYLPGKHSLDNMGFYYTPNCNTSVAVEKDIYADVIENGAFEFMANSFLVEASLTDLKENKFIYSALSSDRLREYQVGTSFDSAGFVHKYPLFPEGAKHIADTANNTARLEKTGIQNWKTEYNNGILTNEFCKNKTADAVLTEKYRSGDILGVLGLYEALYEEVLKSSEGIDPGKNLMLSVGIGKNLNRDYGPILRSVSIDMIFRNAFYDAGKFVWFDQEWQLENVPAKYVLYRAIANYYTKNKWAAGILSLDAVINHFDMFDTWEDFIAFDRVFCTSVVDYDYLKVKHNFEDSSAEKCRKKSLELLRQTKPDYKQIKDRLYTPTFMDKIDGTYYIVDCWHDRVIASESLCDISKWTVVDKKLKHPHSIAKLGKYLVTEDTENNRICFYTKSDTGFEKQHEIFCKGRPHRIIQGLDSNSIIVTLSKKQSIMLVSLNPDATATGQPFITKEYAIDAQNKYLYIRSVTLIDNKLWAVTNDGVIVVLKAEAPFDVLDRYRVPEGCNGLNDIVKLGKHFYVSVYNQSGGLPAPHFLYYEDENALAEGKCEDIYGKLNMQGVPYFFTQIDGKLCAPEIDSNNRIVLYNIDDGKISTAEVIFDFGRATQDDVLYNEMK